MSTDGVLALGQLWEEDFKGLKTFRGTSLINIQDEFDPIILNEIKRFLDSIKNFDEKHKSLIKDKLSKI